jgi:hypothetical protein
MQVTVDGDRCTLQEYDFSVNQWNTVEETRWLMRRTLAEIWVNGWNTVDRRDAILALPDPEPDRPEHRERHSSTPLCQSIS